MDDLDRRLLTVIQKGIPIRSRPFEALGQSLRIDHAETLLRIFRLKKKGLLGKIRAIFDNRRFGYRSALGALKASEPIQPKVLQTVNSHPGVTYHGHYNHEFNSWFLLSVPAKDSLDEALERLKRQTKAKDVLNLPMTRLYKTDPNLEGFIDFGNSVSRVDELSTDEKLCIRLLQDEFPLTDDPFYKWASSLGWTESKFVSLTLDLIEKGILKKIAGNLFAKPEKLDPVRALVVWQVPGEKIDSVGQAIASKPEAKHCCRRQSDGRFPYSLFAFIQLSEVAECSRWIRSVEIQIGPWPHLVLFQDQEYKRSGLSYFEDTWNERKESFEGQSLELASS